MKPPLVGPYSPYLDEAKDALRYVKDQLTLGAYNSPIEWLRPWRTLPSLMHQTSSAFDASLKRGIEAIEARHLPRDQARVAVIELWAKLALDMKAGNCGLQAAVAFKYLKDRAIAPIDLMGFVKRGDHGFVVLNRLLDMGSSSFAEWSHGAVICDPWNWRVGIAAMMGVWYGSTDPTLIGRWDG
jgi:hypothetical protein